MTITTRFAPSPTGLLHVGNLRTALLNWMLTRKQGGRFILRIDDTDAERSKPEYEAAIREDLAWLGLHWDEEARQSDRMARYHKAAEDLRGAGRLYACYETPTELELKRKTLLNRGLPPVYDRAALELTDAQRAAFEAEGRKPHWRFKLDQTRVAWRDGVRGDVEIDCASISDPVLIRGDGAYLYTLCSVCDDIDMNVTDIVRGEDHVANTAVQIQIMRAMGAAPPRFAHAALLVGASGEGLSKRIGSTPLRELRAREIEPMAVLSLLARLGTADPVEPRLEPQQLAEHFALDRLGRAPARFDPEDLAALNAKILHETPYEAVADRLAALGAPEDRAQALWLAARGNLEKLGDIAVWIDVIEGRAEGEVAPEDIDYVKAAMALAPPRPWDAQSWADSGWKDWTGRVKAQTGRKGRGLFLPLRRALTGRDSGPDMAALLPLMRG